MSCRCRMPGSSLNEYSEVCPRGATQEWFVDALPYFACDLEHLIKKKTYGNWPVHT